MIQPDLAEVEAVRDFIGKRDTGDDSLLELMVRSASSMIRNHCDRRFSTPKAVETREFYVREYEDRLYLDEVFLTLDVVSIITQEGLAVPHWTRAAEGSPTKGLWVHFKSGHGTPHDLPEDHGNRFIYNYADGPVQTSLSGMLLVRANFGWPQIPDEIKFATMACVKYWYETEVAHFGRTYDAVEGRVIIPEHLPSLVMNLLSGGDWVHPQKKVLA